MGEDKKTQGYQRYVLHACPVVAGMAFEGSAFELPSHVRIVALQFLGPLSIFRQFGILTWGRTH